MPLTKGSKRLYEWLRDRARGEIHSYEVVMKVSGWNTESTLKTYLGKNKLAPFLVRTSDRRLRTVMDGSEISEKYFHEVFTQSSPRRITLGEDDQFDGEKGSYRLIEKLGQGAVGHVWSARQMRPQPTMVAIKVMMPREGMFLDSKLVNVRERFRQEATNGRHLDHPRVVRYVDMGEVERNPWIAMELADRSVGDRVRKEGALSEEEASLVILHCVQGLEYLHSGGGPHRDIKPDNLLEFEDTYKIGDLGIVKWGDFDPAFTKGGTVTRASVQLGSWFYMAPEQQEDAHEAVAASDIYALAVTWIELLTGALPSPHAIGSRAYRSPSEDDEINRIIKAMLEYQPGDRPTLAEIRSVLGE